MAYLPVPLDSLRREALAADVLHQLLPDARPCALELCALGGFVHGMCSRKGKVVPLCKYPECYRLIMPLRECVSSLHTVAAVMSA
jgi:hypothetical protein